MPRIFQAIPPDVDYTVQDKMEMSLLSRSICLNGSDRIWGTRIELWNELWKKQVKSMKETKGGANCEGQMICLRDWWWSWDHWDSESDLKMRELKEREVYHLKMPWSRKEFGKRWHSEEAGRTGTQWAGEMVAGDKNGEDWMKVWIWNIL